MEDILTGMEGGYRVSITDSTMMWIVHCAMDKAHEKVKSTGGVIARLNEISRFYELAVMQIEGCLKFVQDQAGKYVIERSHEEEVLFDLTEIRDRLQGRLRDSELAISDKDRELAERVENELKLKEALEMKDKELDSLRSILVLERSKSEGVEEFIMSKRKSGDDDREGVISELKNSVDQQVLNIRQILEPEYELIKEERLLGIENKQLERMDSDINILKGTLDLAFSKMHNVIFLSEWGPIEKKWMWTIEKEAVGILIKGFMRDFKQNFETELKRREKQITLGLKEHLSDLMKQITRLRTDVDSFTIQGTVVQSRASGKSTPIGEGLYDSSSKVMEEKTKQLNEQEESEEDCKHYVAKMIKNHESIIKKKSVEPSLIKRELYERGTPPLRKEKDLVGLKKRMEEVVLKLNNLLNEDASLPENCGVVGEEYPEQTLPRDDNSGGTSFEDIWEKMHKNPNPDGINKEMQNKIMLLEQEKEDMILQTMIFEDTYGTLFECLISDFQIELQTNKVWCLIQEEIYGNLIEETVNETIEKLESDYKIDSEIRNAICNKVCIESTRDLQFAINVVLEHNREEEALECRLKEDIQKIALGEMCKEMNEQLESSASELIALGEICKEMNEQLESSASELLFIQEMNWILIDEIIKDIEYKAGHALPNIKTDDFSSKDKLFESNVEYSVKDDVFILFLTTMVEEWETKVNANSFESHIREEITRLVITEAAEEVCTLYTEIENKHEKTPRMFFPDNTFRYLVVGRLKILTESICALLESLKSDEDQVSGVSSDPGGENLLCRKLLSKETNMYRLPHSKAEKALHQLGVFKDLLIEFGSSFSIDSGGAESTRYQRTRETSSHEEKDTNEMVEAGTNPSDSVLTPRKAISRAFKDFECTSEKFVLINSRLEKLKLQLLSLIEVVLSLRKQESVYKKAFVIRCENLRKAENEVDLLGDQVDILLALLENIYMILHQHSPVLQQHSEVLDILKLIKKELFKRTD